MSVTWKGWELLNKVKSRKHFKDHSWLKAKCYILAKQVGPWMWKERGQNMGTWNSSNITLSCQKIFVEFVSLSK